MAPDLQRRTAVVTGATSGIGEECAKALAGLGATVILAVRNHDKAQATLERIRQAHPGADVVVEGLPPLDIASNDSIRAFAAAYLRSGRPLHLLVNNAGAFTTTRAYTEEGVAELCQVNHMGAYLLTRLLEGLLVASAPARVVTVSSVTHRMGVIGDDPLQDFIHGDYGHHTWNTKLANVLFAYELQRRLGRHGVQSCAVDPGSVRTDVWRHSSWVVRRLVEFFYAPPEVGAQPLVFACVVPWERITGNEAEAAPERQLRGMLGGTLMHYFGWPFSGPLGAAKQAAWTVAALLVAVADWPLRCFSKGRVLKGVVAVPSSPLSYDESLAAALWEASAEAAGVPSECQLKPAAKVAAC